MKRLGTVLQMIKIEHTVFALPFAYLGAFLGAGGLPDAASLFWIAMAMVGARSSAMAFNRLADRVIDSRNPRTRNRALPSGRVNPAFVVFFVVGSALLFFVAAWQLNWLATALSPLALGVVLLYSHTKRFTGLSHLVLGLALAIAPVGGWIGVTGTFETNTLYLAAAVLFWVAGFDIIYSCQDVEFDRAAGLHSIPAALGIRAALFVSSIFHIVMVLLLCRAWLLFELGAISWFGLALVAAGLIYEHSLLKTDDLSRVNAAFFTTNGIISAVLFVTVGVDLCLSA